MMTQNEKEDKVFQEFEKIQSELEILMGKSLNKKNYKNAIIEFTKNLAANSEYISAIPDDGKRKIESFFLTCQLFLGEVLWNSISNKGFKIYISYGDNLPLTCWNIPVDMFFSTQRTFETSMQMMADNIKLCFQGYFASPDLREAVMAGDEEAVKYLYQSFSRPSMPSCLNNLIFLKECFPDFYNHITTKLDIMTVENMQEFIENSNVTRQINKTRQGKKKRVSRVKKISPLL